MMPSVSLRSLRFGCAAVLAVLVLAVALAAAPRPAAAQDDGFRVLVYSRTEGFRHASITSGRIALQEMGDEHGFAVETTEDPAAFTDDNLARFAVVVFLNTTGDVLPAEGEAAFERFLRGGGGYVGIHSAADTEYEWAFYGEILGGAWFKNHPVQQSGVIVKDPPDHPSTAHLPDRWRLPLEEFYSFRQNPRPNVRVLLTVDEDTYEQDPNTSNLPDNPDWMEGDTGTMGDHPMSWCHTIDDGHVWYTALGHENYLYEVPDYLEHLRGGILTAAGRVEAEGCTVAAATPTPSPSTTTTEPEERSAEREDSSAPLPATGPGALVPAAVLLLLLAATRRNR